VDRVEEDELTRAHGEGHDPGPRLLQPLVESYGGDCPDCGDDERKNNDDGVDVNLMGLGGPGWEHEHQKSVPQR